ncbi:acyltransferase family protein [Neobacillus drentensis]|uniref:acyltransferase family protein n=1 Tax=Neobacillus drentensis TaxID=220684 RepID=UPI003B589ABF
MMKKNFFGIDLLKMVAIISVICVHFLRNTSYYSVSINSKLLFIQTFYRQIFIVCVPLFIMATGFLQSRDRRGCTVRLHTNFFFFPR